MKWGAEAKAPAKSKPEIEIDYSGLRKGLRLSVEADGVFWAAEAVAVSKKRTYEPVKITYLGYHKQYDEWVPASRLRSKAIVPMSKASLKPAFSPATQEYSPCMTSAASEESTCPSLREPAEAPKAKDEEEVQVQFDPVTLEVPLISGMHPFGAEDPRPTPKASEIAEAPDSLAAPNLALPPHGVMLRQRLLANRRSSWAMSFGGAASLLPPVGGRGIEPSPTP